MKLTIYLILLLFPLFSNAADIFPTDLLYKGHAIDPLCFVELEYKSAVVDLATCGIQSQPNRYIDGDNTILRDKGYSGYDYAVKINKTVNLHGYSYYKIIGRVGQAFIVETIHHPGGSGDMSALLLVTRDGDILNIQVLNTGDRCNHGLVNVKHVHSAKHDYLIYGQKQTSYDFLSLSHRNPHHLKPYDDLADCAVCCKAVAVFQRDLRGDIHKETLQYVDLAAFPQEPVDTSQPKTIQMCFDRLVQKYVTRGQSRLEDKQWIGFVKEMNDCGGKAHNH